MWSMPPRTMQKPQYGHYQSLSCIIIICFWRGWYSTHAHQQNFVELCPKGFILVLSSNLGFYVLISCLPNQAPGLTVHVLQSGLCSESSVTISLQQVTHIQSSPVLKRIVSFQSLINATSTHTYIYTIKINEIKYIQLLYMYIPILLKSFFFSHKITSVCGQVFGMRYSRPCNKATTALLHLLGQRHIPKTTPSLQGSGPQNFRCFVGALMNRRQPRNGQGSIPRARYFCRLESKHVLPTFYK